MYAEPKVFRYNFLEIGITNQDEKLCMCIEDDVNNGQIFLYYSFDEEYYNTDQDGNKVEYHQQEVYRLQKIAKSFEEFLQILYANG